MNRVLCFVNCATFYASVKQRTVKIVSLKGVKDEKSGESDYYILVNVT